MQRTIEGTHSEMNSLFPICNKLFISIRYSAYFSEILVLEADFWNYLVLIRRNFSVQLLKSYEREVLVLCYLRTEMIDVAFLMHRAKFVCHTNF